MLFNTLVIAALVIAAVLLAAHVFLLAPDHSRFDGPLSESGRKRRTVSPENTELLRQLDGMLAEVNGTSLPKRLQRLRRIMDEGVIGAPVDPDELGVSLKLVDAGGVPSEWVLAPDADSERRILYIHGGGFVVGSPSSARMLTAKLSKLCGAAVLSVDYRLMPENRRMASVDDCQSAYRWILDNGPDETGPAREIFVAGDSAGGNLALMLSAWARDNDLRLMDGVIVFAPSTDSTLAGKTFRDNIETDPLLGPPLRTLARLPAPIRALFGLFSGRINPRNPLVSPQFGQLSDLPPTLVQVSESEVLLDDARRYVNKAISQGSPAELQTWPGMVHVFQMYWHMLPEANEALAEAARFVEKSASNRSAAVSAQDSGAIAE